MERNPLPADPSLSLLDNDLPLTKESGVGLKETGLTRGGLDVAWVAGLTPLPVDPLLFNKLFKIGLGATGNAVKNRSLSKLSRLLDNWVVGIDGIDSLPNDSSFFGLLEEGRDGLGRHGVGLCDTGLVGSWLVAVRPFLMKPAFLRLLKKGLLGIGLTVIRLKQLDISGTSLSGLSLSGTDLARDGSSEGR